MTFRNGLTDKFISIDTKICHALQNYTTCILQLFFDYPTKHFQLREICRTLNLGMPSVRNHVKRLESKKFVMYSLLVFIVAGAIFASVFFLTGEKNMAAVNFKTIEDDPKIDSKITGSYMDGNNLVIEYNSDVRPRVEGINSYEIRDNSVVIPNYTMSKFRLIFGSSSDIYEFGAETDGGIISGDKVYINDSMAYLVAYPHTITDSGYVNFNLTSKIFSGDIDVVWGFNTSLVKPKSAEYYSPYSWNETKSYTCNPPYWYNYTLSPKYFWCWINDTIGNETILTYEHYFEKANLTANTTYWNETYYKGWKDISSTFSSMDYEYGGMNKWYYVRNVPIAANQSYWVRGYVDIVPQLGENSGKYWFCVKPSSLSISDAIIQDKLYCIDPWWNSSWQKCKSITITNVGSSTLTNFPAYINVSYDSDMLSNYQDLRFVSASCNNGGTILPYEIENYTTTNANVWVNVTLPSTGTTISVYYNNNTPIGYGQNKIGVWDSNYKSVWHLNANATSINTNDSTSNNNVGSASGAVLNRTGAIDGAGQFDGGNDYIRADGASTNIVGNNLTLEAWIKPNATMLTSSLQPLVADRHTSSTAGYSMSIYYDGVSCRFVTASQDCNTYTAYSPGYLSASSFSHAVCNYNTTNLNIYVNGVLRKNDTCTGNLLTSASSFMIATRENAAGLWYGGTIDEVRVSINRNADWINQSYRMVANQSIYVVFGSEELPSTCAYSSGNWDVDCKDNCTITTNTNLGGGNFTLSNSSGAGTFTMKADITNIGQLVIGGNCNIVIDSGKAITMLGTGKVNGASCSSGAECGSGFCADEVCCNNACTGSTCQRCDSYSNAGAGTCGYISTAVDPNNECTAGGTGLASDGCTADACTGTGYACGYQTSGEGNCPACKNCTGATSIACVNRADNTQDTTSPGTCSATCKKCSAGSCVDQGSTEDLFGHCTASNPCGVVIINSASEKSCTTTCAEYNTKYDGNCNGAGACTAAACGCTSVGTDAAGTNACLRSYGDGDCYDLCSGYTCAQLMNNYAVTCEGYTIFWTWCKCQ